MAGLKQCTKCKQWKTEDAFYKKGSNRHGLRPRCIVCMKEDRQTDSYKAAQNAYWASEKGLAARKRYWVSDAKREAAKRWRASDKGKAYEQGEGRKTWRHSYNRSDGRKEIVLRYERSKRGKENRRACELRYTHRHPEKRRAKSAVRNQVKQGKMPPAFALLCAKCNNPAVHYHHYLGYDMEHWLDVVPLCQKCHYAEHH